MYGLLPVLTVVHLLEYYSTESGRFFPPYRQIGDFRVAFRLSFKASLSAKPFTWKLVLFTCKWTKTNFHVKGWRTGTRFETEAKGNSVIAY